MRVFSIVGLLISLLIVGWLSATYLATVTGTGVLPNDRPGASQSATDGQAGINPAVSPIDRARELASQDQKRQKDMESFIKEHQ
ncbi:MAG: hypothetical protein LBG29_01470 [Synergistaceae bacterium]|jgi:hypothetical protein|nr:hypothetical protein [Synergistaceae bacterium]